jgi:hypothetical protein
MIENQTAEMKPLTFNNTELTNSINNWLDKNYVEECVKRGGQVDSIMFAALVECNYCLPYFGAREDVIDHLGVLLYNWKIRNKDKLHTCLPK